MEVVEATVFLCQTLISGCCFVRYNVVSELSAQPKIFLDVVFRFD